MFVWLIAIVSTTACIFFWFRDVRRIMLNRKSMVDSAASQLASWRRKTADAWDEPEIAEVIRRSESIYQQAIEHYNRALHKPLNYLPGRLLGFREVPSCSAQRTPDTIDQP